MRLYLYIIIGLACFFTSCSSPSTEQIPEAGHTALGTSAPPTINPVRTDSLQYLTQYIGKSPGLVKLWDTEPLKSKLEVLLGDDFDEFKQRMQEAAPLQEERVLYTIGKSTDPPYLAFFLVDIETNQLHVSIIEDGVRKQYQTKGADLYLPTAVEQAL